MHQALTKVLDIEQTIEFVQRYVMKMAAKELALARHVEEAFTGYKHF